MKDVVNAQLVKIVMRVVKQIVKDVMDAMIAKHVSHAKQNVKMVNLAIHYIKKKLRNAQAVQNVILAMVDIQGRMLLIVILVILAMANNKLKLGLSVLGVNGDVQAVTYVMAVMMDVLLMAKVVFIVIIAAQVVELALVV